MMRHCWEKAPEDRPTFKELYTSLSKYIERIAGYLELGYNPFSTVEGSNSGNGEEVGVQSSVSPKLVPAQIRDGRTSSPDDTDYI